MTSQQNHLFSFFQKIDDLFGIPMDTIVKWQKVWHDKLFQCKVFLRFFKNFLNNPQDQKF